MATETYRFDGAKNPADKTARVILEGSTSNPESYVDLKDTIELDDEKVKELRAAGLKFTKVNEDGSDEDEGSPTGEPETRAEQQKDQVASGAQHAAATKDKDNTPAGREAKAKSN